MKSIFKWLFRLFPPGGGAGRRFLPVAGHIIRVVMENSHPRADGHGRPDREVHAGLVEPTITIKNFKVFNPPSFGGTPSSTFKEITLNTTGTLSRRVNCMSRSYGSTWRTGHRQKRGR